MQCEVCDAIRRLGLDPSAHDLWFCSAPHPAWSSATRQRLNRFFSIKVTWQYQARRLLHAFRHLPRLHPCPAYRQRIIRLGL